MTQQIEKQEDVVISKVSAYEEYTQEEGIPKISGFYIEDLKTVDVAPWPRLGVNGVWIDLIGTGGTNDGAVIELPGGKSTTPQHHLFEAMVYVVSGNGAVQKGGGVSVRPGYDPVGDTLPSLVVRASTISGNSAMDGGGLASMYGNPVDVSDSTIAFNASTRPQFEGWTGGGGGVCVNSYSLRLANSIVSNNSAYNGGSDVTLFNLAGPTPSIAGDHDIILGSVPAPPPDTITTDPGLLPLADNGGPTATHGLASGSVAIDAGRPATGLFFDQRGRGFPRTIGASADIGAFESGTPAPPLGECSEDAVRAAIAGAPEGAIVDL